MIKKTSIILLMFNISLISIIGILYVIYGVLDYGINPLLDVAINLLGLNPTGNAMNTVNNIVTIFTSIPNMLDWFVLAIFLGLVLDLLWLSVQSKKMSEWVFLGTILIYIPLFIWFLTQIDVLIKSILESLSSALVSMPNMTFYNFIVTHNISLTAVLFALSISINVIDWNIVRNKLTPNREEDSSDFYEE